MRDPAGATGRPLNLLALARGAPGRHQAVPGDALEVLAVAESGSHPALSGRWMLLLSGDLLVDLPYGDFRQLGPGDRLALPKDVVPSLKPLAASVLLLGPPAA